MEMWKTKPVSHISTPPTTTDKGQKRRYTNIPLGTKDRSGQTVPSEVFSSSTRGCDCCAFAALGAARSNHPTSAVTASFIRDLLRNSVGSALSDRALRVFLPGHTLLGRR